MSFDADEDVPFFEDVAQSCSGHGDDIIKPLFLLSSTCAMSPWPTPLTLLLIPFLFTRVNADPATLPFADCFAASNSNIDQRISVDFVYAQVLPNEEWGQYLNLTILGSSPQEVSGFTNQSSSLGTPSNYIVVQ